MPQCRCTTACWLIAASIISSEIAVAQSGPRPRMDASISPEQRAVLLVKAMTLDEKIAMMHGVQPIPIKGYIGYVPGIARLGIPALTEADGRAGVGNDATQVTLLPAPIGAASSWDPNLLNTFGQVLGEEEWKKGANVALSPSIDVVRVPEWGRTFESYGEDPYFNGQMAQAEIEGIQSQGPIADANMYVTMNQESNRFKEDSIVDERTLHEIYLTPFAAAVEQGHVGTVMCAYVKTKGIYSCENADLLTDILRKDLHFDGFVVSDWGATHSTVDAVKNGLNQEMPGDKYFGAELRAAVQSGRVSQSLIDERVEQILVPMFRQGLFDKPSAGNWSADVRTPEHASFSRRVAEEGTVLLKNDGGLLPLAKGLSIAVIGEAKPKAEGAGSSGVKAPYIVSPVDGLRKAAALGVSISYAQGNDLAAAVEAARKAAVAIVFVHTDETEGQDRPNLMLPGHQDQMIEAVANANPKTIVVLDTGGPVLMPWVDQVAGILEAWYPGQEDGNAIAAIVYGDLNPSAKLPLTFPRSATAIPTAAQQQWPGIGGRSVYSERLEVGYRWYDATNTQPLFPFGFGLSYTTFRLGGLTVSPAQVQPGERFRNVVVRVSVTNTGKRAGAEVVQVYVQQPAANGEPPHQLRAFGKVGLQPGETKPVTLSLDRRSFSIYNADARQWKTPAGTYQILVGTSSRDLPLHGRITVSP